MTAKDVDKTEHSDPQKSPKPTSQALQDLTGLLAATHDPITR